MCSRTGMAGSRTPEPLCPTLPCHLVRKIAKLTGLGLPLLTAPFLFAIVQPRSGPASASTCRRGGQKIAGRGLTLWARRSILLLSSFSKTHSSWDCKYSRAVSGPSNRFWLTFQASRPGRRFACGRCLGRIRSPRVPCRRAVWVAPTDHLGGMNDRSKVSKECRPPPWLPLPGKVIFRDYKMAIGIWTTVARRP